MEARSTRQRDAPTAKLIIKNTHSTAMIQSKISDSRDMKIDWKSNLAMQI